MDTTARNANAVLLPAIDHLNLTSEIQRYLDNGGKTLLLGESRAEYVARRMTPERVQSESSHQFSQLSQAVRSHAGANLIAVDFELPGIQRLHKLVPALPNSRELHLMSSDQIEGVCREVGVAARGLGVNMALGPIVDIVTGVNPWLEGRTLGTDAREVARIAAACVRGLQGAGVISTVKHFPGHADITGDPAIEIAEVRGAAGSLEPGFLPFHAVIKSGVKAVMTGPSLVPAIDPKYPSSLSAITMQKLRDDFGFQGLIVSDDLDAKATLLDRTVGQAAVLALRAGADLLLLAAEGQVNQVASQIASAVRSGELPEERLSEAAQRVIRLADDVQ